MMKGIIIINFIDTFFKKIVLHFLKKKSVCLKNRNIKDFLFKVLDDKVKKYIYNEISFI